ncbi:MAG: DNA-3-methyladenine glycosylase 2 family protein [Myxococcota bacterium]
MSKKAHEHLVEATRGLPRLEAALHANGPLRLRRRSAMPVVDFLCRAVAGQQLSVKAASTIWGRILEDADGKALCDYLARDRTDSLRRCGLSAAKCRAMHAIASHELDASELKSLPHPERVARLTAIWGVGQWTADMMGIFYFGDRDIWPDGDVTARKTLAALTSRRRKTVRTAERFAPYRSYLAMHMWHHADAAPT